MSLLTNIIGILVIAFVVLASIAVFFTIALAVLEKARIHRVHTVRSRIASEITERNAEDYLKDEASRPITRWRIYNSSSSELWVALWWIPVSRLEAQAMELLDAVDEGV